MNDSMKNESCNISDWFTESSDERLILWILLWTIDSMNALMNDWTVNVSMNDYFCECLDEWSILWMPQRTIDSGNDLMNDRFSQCFDVRMILSMFNERLMQWMFK